MNERGVISMAPFVLQFPREWSECKTTLSLIAAVDSF